MDELAGPSRFPATAWSLLEAVALGRPDALDRLVRLYWRPVYIYLRRKGRGPDDAADATQSFFVHLLERELLGHADASRGRFRSWLRAVLEHFLANEARLAKALRRGSGVRPISLDLVAGIERELETERELTPDAAFERAWALDVIERALERLQRELEVSGQRATIDLLRRRLGLPGPEPLPGEVSDVAVHRARKRLRALIVEEASDTVGAGSTVEEEVADLFRAIAGGR